MTDGVVLGIILFGILIVCGTCNRVNDDHDDGDESGTQKGNDIKECWNKKRLEALGTVVVVDCGEEDEVNYGGGGGECAVCLEQFKDGEECRVLERCSHVFHKACIDEWIPSNDRCPLCRVCVWGDEEPCGDDDAV
ncbi:hypothetical protein Tsubulata_032391 [Turnera subulata]|uniref:RING-type domain-containing protein n=1 Tax=Turnera subulata TaxID=218843 RepID=A0A9Q0J1A7_9ROSI|nr:hypothetical protein Tsubulata_032391 [Turnera subulata]